MKTIFILLLLQVTTPAFAQTKGDDFKEKYLFTHLHLAIVKPVDKVSKCFKFNKPSKEILQTYDHCKKDPKLASPLEEAMGTCLRKDGAKAYFFEDVKECESARTEIVESLKED
jgi:hypothetical protein